MRPSELKARFRKDVDDLVEPFLWDDDLAMEYMDEAQQMFCRLAYGIRDSSSDVTKIQLTAHQATAPVDPSVLKVYSARLASTGRPISVLSYADVYLVQNNAHHLPFSFSQIETEGNVRAIITDMDDGRVKVVHIPTEDDYIQCVVDRMPFTTPTRDDNVIFEVRKEHHVNLVSWMKHLAYGRHDADTFDPDKSAKYEAEFRAYCEQAQAERDRRQDKPRLIAYGGV